MTAGAGSTRNSSNIELSGDHGVVYCNSDHRHRRRSFCLAVRAAFGGTNRTLDLGLSAESLRRSAVKAIPAPTRMTASVAFKLPGAMQLMQVPMIVGASNMRCLFHKELGPFRWPKSGQSQSSIFRAGVPRSEDRVLNFLRRHSLATMTVLMPPISKTQFQRSPSIVSPINLSIW